VNGTAIYNIYETEVSVIVGGHQVGFRVLKWDYMKLYISERSFL